MKVEIFQSKCLFSNPSNTVAKLEYVRVSERMLLGVRMKRGIKHCTQDKYIDF